ncbi:hypothetical protein, partial [Streptomyces radiopugnans]|uniref:hypothetical protein n=1 Tax=Streptomyces radiopugnans TaxID=403935 RepID=UPI003F1A18D8
QPPTPLRWAQALHDTLHDDARFQADPKAFTTEQDHKVLKDEAWQQRRAEAAILRRLLGLLAYAANPRNIDLSDRPELARDITLLVAELDRAPG